MNDHGNGYRVETYGAGRYLTVAWYASERAAQNDANRRTLANAYYGGLPPRVVPAGLIGTCRPIPAQGHARD